MRRMICAVVVFVLAAGSAELEAQARATTGIGEARRIIRRADPARGLSTTGINLSEEARRREERDRRCGFDRTGYYDAYGRFYGYDRYDRYDRHDDAYRGGSYDNRTYVGGSRFNRDGRYDPNGRYDRDGRLIQVVPPGTATTATTGTITTARTSTGGTYSAPPAAARVESARTAGGRVVIASTPYRYDGDFDSGCGYVDRGRRHR